MYDSVSVILSQACFISLLVQLYIWPYVYYMGAMLSPTKTMLLLVCMLSVVQNYAYLFVTTICSGMYNYMHVGLLSLTGRLHEF